MGVFGKALFATPPKLGGVQLRPFSAYHAQALMELDSPFITGKEEPTAGETATALIICSSLRADGLAPVERALRSWRERLRWNLRWLRYDLDETANALSDYIVSSSESPRIWENTEEAGSVTGADWPFYIVSICAQNMHGIAYDDLWDMPLSELICHKAIIGETNGAYEIAERDFKMIESKRQESEAA